MTKASMARPDGTPRDVDRKFVEQFKVSTENQSPYLAKNIRTFTGRPDQIDPDDEGFQERNQMHSVNGYVFGNDHITARMLTRYRVLP